MLCNNNSVQFNAEKDIPSLEGRVILVTGGSGGLGKQAVLEYARHNPRLIWLAARSIQKANAAVDEIRQQVPGAAIQVVELDLASFASIKNGAATVLSASPRLDILMLNAGIMAVPSGQTAEGYEVQFGTNHMGHALLTKLLLPLLTKTAAGEGRDVRIVTLSSDGHSWASKTGIDFATLKTCGEGLGPLGCYGQSKLANILWTRQLARAHPQFTVASVHPGVVGTQIMENARGTPAMLRTLVRGAVHLGLITSVETGVRNQLWASVAPSGDGRRLVSGGYYVPVGVAGQESALAKDEELARRLWEWTDKELEGHTVAAP
ncbi:hypothetical protein C7999DRAFT_17548 [Corynascus novoguineensis]|uniref:Short-chain dehydrogenase/reductase n=1 Tax=Corynascus novoguineensis TaxID=1126955 RepID=A0AAN7HJB1_9PEZI|nr:hypothetical protein C7999DRAFT_17548 [Corynascus novoguineensis]